MNELTPLAETGPPTSLRLVTTWPLLRPRAMPLGARSALAFVLAMISVGKSIENGMNGLNGK